MAVSLLSLFYFCSPIPRSPSPGSSFQECTECPYLCPCKHAGEPAAEAAFLRRSQTDGSQHTLLSGTGVSNGVHAYQRQCCRPAESLRPCVWTNLNPLLRDAYCALRLWFSAAGERNRFHSCLSAVNIVAAQITFSAPGGQFNRRETYLKNSPLGPADDDP